MLSVYILQDIGLLSIVKLTKSHFVINKIDSTWILRKT